jgi:hypothetical protein
MMGFEVAPVAPSARFLTTKSGSIESSQSLVPVAMSDLSDISESFHANELLRIIILCRFSASASAVFICP